MSLPIGREKVKYTRIERKRETEREREEEIRARTHAQCTNTQTHEHTHAHAQPVVAVLLHPGYDQAILQGILQCSTEEYTHTRAVCFLGANAARHQSPPARLKRGEDYALALSHTHVHIRMHINEKYMCKRWRATRKRWR